MFENYFSLQIAQDINRQTQRKVSMNINNKKIKNSIVRGVSGEGVGALGVRTP